MSDIANHAVKIKSGMADALAGMMSKQMPTFNVSVEDVLVKVNEHPRIPQSKTAVGLVVVMDEQQFNDFSRYVRTQSSSPAIRLGFGVDATQQAHAAELAARDKLVADAQAALKAAQDELAKYRAAYDKNPAQEAGRFGLLDVD